MHVTLIVVAGRPPQWLVYLREKGMGVS